MSAGRLREQPASRRDIVTLWRKASERLRDAALPGMSLEGSLEAAYHATHTACLAILATRGLRTAGDRGHHEMAFAGVETLGAEGLEDLVPDSEEIRALRKGSLYDPVLATETDRGRAIAWARSVLPSMRAVLVAWDPTLDTELWR